VPPFRVESDFAPAGDQPRAIEKLAAGIQAGEPAQTLLGITGSGKSATIAWTIEAVQRPTLVIAPNKSLAAQLANEFREFFPDNAVEYFVSYYDYYQPEAYMPSSDTYIEKDSSVNDEIDRLRHATTASLLTRRDVIVVASVSCIYGLGSPDRYRDEMLYVKQGEANDQRAILCCQGIERGASTLAGVRTEHHDGHALFGQNRAGSVGTVHARHVEVHRHDVWPCLPCQPHGLGTVPGLLDDETPVALQQTRDSATHEGAVVDYQDLQLVRHESQRFSART
jgi:hypothetical protein